MRTTHRVRAGLVALVAILAGSFGVAAPAIATTPTPGAPPAVGPTLHISRPAKMGTDGMMAPAVEIDCAGAPTPDPAYSASNKTVHYGAWGQCTAPVEIEFTLYLYEVTGTAGHMTRHLEATHGWGCVCTTLSDSFSLPCLGTSSNHWQARLDAEGDGFPFTPNPDYGPTVSLPCWAGN